MLISIILCTYNGSGRLASVVESIGRQAGVENINFELLIIDNASTDGTKSEVDALSSRFPWIRYIHEDTLGLNYARNRGIKASAGDIIIFIDDDITLESSWLSALDGFFVANPEAMLAGGRVSCIVPSDVAIPQWLALTGEYSFPYITFDVQYGDTVQKLPLTDYCMPVGPNMAFRREVFDRHGFFRTDLGLKGKSLMPGAEFEFFKRLSCHDLCWFYLPAAHVFHPIKSSQLSQDYFLKRTYGVGRVAAKTILLPSHIRKIGSLPIFCIRLFLEALFRYLAATVSHDNTKVFYCKAQVYKVLGMSREYIAPRTD